MKPAEWIKPLTLPAELDPFGLESHQSGAKLDAEKTDAGLLLSFGRALLAVSDIATFGAKKYTRDGWVSVPNGFDRYTAAMMRHLLQENHGPEDMDSGYLHAAHVAWNALARLELILRSPHCDGKMMEGK